MVFNIEYGGVQISFDKVVEAVRLANPDILLLSEGQDSTERLAKSLGWPVYYYHSKMQIISKYPVLENPTEPGAYALIELAPHQFVLVSNSHLSSDVYGPEEMQKQIATHKIDKIRLAANESKIRLSGLTTVQLGLPKKFAGIPIFLGGDFNTPSSLDYTANAIAARSVADGRDNIYRFEWPVSQALAQAGFRDSFRQIYPDPAAVPGYTYKAKRPGILGDNPPKQEQPDRIDFLYVAGDTNTVKTDASIIIGEPQARDVTLAVSPPWPSDHRAILSSFTIQLGRLPTAPAWTHSAPRLPNQDAGPLEPAIPTIATLKPEYTVGEPIEISWNNGPGKRWDGIAIYKGRLAQLAMSPTASKRPEPIMACTIAGTSAGTLQGPRHGKCTFTSGIHENFPNINEISPDTWPLAPGVYTACYYQEDIRPHCIITRTFTIR